MPIYGPGSGFINFQRRLDLNRPQALNQAGGLATGLETEAQGAEGAVRAAPQGQELPGLGDRVTHAQSGLNATASTEGLDALAQRSQGGGPNYTAGQSRWDAAYMQGAGAQDRFTPLRQRYSSLGALLASQRTPVAPLPISNYARGPETDGGAPDRGFNAPPPAVPAPAPHPGAYGAVAGPGGAPDADAAIFEKARQALERKRAAAPKGWGVPGAHDDDFHLLGFGYGG